jgi:hypothetical protein
VAVYITPAGIPGIGKEFRARAAVPRSLYEEDQLVAGQKWMGRGTGNAKMRTIRGERNIGRLRSIRVAGDR